MCRKLCVYLKYLKRGTYEVLLLFSIMHVAGVEGTQAVMKIRGFPAKGSGLRTATVKQTDWLR
jgi:hypothetical protein